MYTGLQKTHPFVRHFLLCLLEISMCNLQYISFPSQEKYHIQLQSDMLNLFWTVRYLWISEAVPEMHNTSLECQDDYVFTYIKCSLSFFPQFSSCTKTWWDLWCEESRLRKMETDLHLLFSESQQANLWSLCRWPSCQHLKIGPWSKTLPNWHHLTRSFGMCEWIICMWQNNRHEKTQFITESHIQFSHTSKEIICLQNLSTFFSPHKPVSHAVCDMSRLENKTRAQQSKTRTQERLN